MTVTDVDVTPDLSHATVWVSVIGDADARRRSIAALGRAMPFVRHRLGGLRLKRIPELHVREDDSAERGTRVLQILDELEQARRRSPGARRSRLDGAPRAAGGEPPAEAEPATAACPSPSPPAARRSHPSHGPGRAARAPAGHRPGDGPPGDQREPGFADQRRPRRRARRGGRAAPGRATGAGRVPPGSRGRRARLGAGAVRWRWRRSASGPPRPAATRSPAMYDFMPGIERFRQAPDPDVDYDLIVVGDCGELARVGRVREEHAELFGRRADRGHRPPRVERRLRRGRLDRPGRGGDVRDDHPAAAPPGRAARRARGRHRRRPDGGRGHRHGHLPASQRHARARCAWRRSWWRPVRPLSDISRRLYRTKPNAQLRLFGLVLARLETSADGGIVWSTLSTDDLSAASARRPRCPRGSSTCSPSRPPPRSRSCSRTRATGPGISVRTRDGGVDAIELTGRFGGWRPHASRRRHDRAAGRSRDPARPGRGRAAGGSASRPRRCPARRRIVTTAEAARSARQVIDGMLVVAKPAGPTSHDVVAIVRRLTGARRVGHGGTLDPFAAGVLPVFLGIATRMVEYHLADEKAYRAAVVFGARSTTDDRDGELTPIEGPAPTRDQVTEALATFEGDDRADPPDYSAVRVVRPPRLRAGSSRPAAGAPATDGYGSTRSRSPTGTRRDPSRPAATVEVRCSAGTYVRAIARDLGAKLGNGAYLGALTRTASGPFRLESATPLDEVRAALAAGTVERLLLPPDTGLDAFPSIRLDTAELGALAHGQVIRHRGEPPAAARARWTVPDRGRRRAAGRHGAPRRRAAPPREGVRHSRRMSFRVVRDMDELPTGLRFVATVGVFDGMHRGHQQVLATLTRRGGAPRSGAGRDDLRAAPRAGGAGTCPAAVVRPARADRPAARGGRSSCWSCSASTRRSGSRRAETFLDRLRTGRDLRGLVMSAESAFGHDRTGTIDTVRRLAAAEGWQVSRPPRSRSAARGSRAAGSGS